LKVAIVGSRKYISKNKIKEFIFKLKEKYGDDVSIVSGGCRYGADKYAKKYALEFGIEYIEYPPIHETHNVYCPEPSYLYGKKYAVWNFFKRNKQIAKFSDIVVGFIPEGVKSSGTESTLKYAKEFKKKIMVII
jgi:predicted Rossmann fold nucleotide-binding protein DprA/Smf involved in DNA uptake